MVQAGLQLNGIRNTMTNVGRQYLLASFVPDGKLKIICGSNSGLNRSIQAVSGQGTFSNILPY